MKIEKKYLHEMKKNSILDAEKFESAFLQAFSILVCMGVVDSDICFAEFF